MVRFSRKSYSTLHEWFSSAGTVSLVVHARPDGDAMGSASALAGYLRKAFGSDVLILAPDAYPSTLDFMVTPSDVIDASSDMDLAAGRIAGSDLIVSLDHGDFSRTDSLGRHLAGARCRKVLIDHHQSPDLASYGLVFSSVDVSSTCELLYHILMRMPGVRRASDLPQRSAFCLMAGMTTDTNNFANSVFPSTLSMAADLLAAGVDRNLILDRLYSSYRENRLRAMGSLLLERMHVSGNGVAYAVFDRQTIARFGLQDGETEGFVNIPLSMSGVRFSLFLKEDGDVFRVSIRSKKGFSASRMARRYFNGGGHENAAGGRLRIPDDLPSADDVEAYVESVTARFLQDEALPQTEQK